MAGVTFLADSDGDEVAAAAVPPHRAPSCPEHTVLRPERYTPPVSAAVHEFWFWFIKRW